MSAKRFKSRSEINAETARREELRTLNFEPRTLNEEMISAEIHPVSPGGVRIETEEGSVLIPRPDAGGAVTEAPPAVSLSPPARESEYKSPSGHLGQACPPGNARSADEKAA